MPAAVPYSGT